MTRGSEQGNEDNASRAKKTSDQTRRDLLIAAGRRFARAGYSAVRLKDIADDVGVTAPLVIRYFGSKEAIFREIITAQTGLEIEAADLDGPIESLGIRLARTFVAYWVDRDINYPAIALIRSLDFEDGKELFEAQFTKRLVEPLARVLAGPDRNLKARLIASQAMGVFLFGLGTILEPDVRTLSDRELSRLVTLHGAALQAIIDT